MEEDAGQSPSSPKTSERKDQLAREAGNKNKGVWIVNGVKGSEAGPPLPFTAEVREGCRLKCLGLETTVPQLPTMLALEGWSEVGPVYRVCSGAPCLSSQLHLLTLLRPL